MIIVTPKLNPFLFRMHMRIYSIYSLEVSVLPSADLARDSSSHGSPWKAYNGPYEVDLLPQTSPHAHRKESGQNISFI